MNQSQAKGVKKYSKTAINTDGSSAEASAAQSNIQAYYIDTVRFKMDSLRSMPEQARSKIDTNRYKLVFMDAQRAYFWRLLILFYQNMVV